jgi:putative inorganic carbon (HCO3(-)) transporter
VLTPSNARNLIVTRQAVAPYARQAGLVVVLAAIGFGLAWLPLPLSAAAVAGGSATLLVLLHPVWGLVALIPLIPFSSLVSLQVGGFNVGGMETLLALVLFAWLVRMAVRREIVIPHPPLLLPWLLWLGAILLSWLGVLSLGDALTETVKWLEMLALYLFMAATIERRHLPWLVGAILLAGTAQAMLGLYQFVFRAGPAGFLLFDGRFLRAYGSFRQPNPYAGYLGLVLPIAYSLLLWGLGSSRQTSPARPGLSARAGWREPGRANVKRQPSAVSRQPSAVGGPTGRLRSQRSVTSPTPYSLLSTSSSLLLTPYFTLPAFGLMLAALYASQSRGAWIGFAAALVAVSLARGGRSAVIFGLAVAVVATAGAVGDVSLPTTITERFADVLPVAGIPDVATIPVTDANFAAVERLAHWQAALAMWRDHPWLGVGFGNYATIYPAYAIGRWLDPLGHAHNYYLNVGAEAGLVGLLGYIFFWLSAFGLAWQAIRRSQGFQRALAAGGLGVLVHLSVHNGLDNLFVQGMYLHVSIVLGLLALIYRAQIDNSGRGV